MRSTSSPSTSDTGVAAPPRGVRAAWALLTLFIVYGSAGTWSGGGPGVVAPLRLSWPDAAQNVLLYLPFGALGVLARGAGRRAGARVVVEVTALAALVILIVEIAQLSSADRTASVVDLAAGSAGALVGALLAPRLGRAHAAGARGARRLGVDTAPDLPALLAIVAALTLVAWWPFDVTLDPSTLAARARALGQDPWRAAPAAAQAAHALSFALLTLLTAVCLTRLRPSRAATLASVSGLLVAGLLDAGQLAMGAAPAGLSAAVWQVGGVVAGGAAFRLARGA